MAVLSPVRTRQVAEGTRVFDRKTDCTGFVTSH
jgi:hypothetical protein